MEISNDQESLFAVNLEKLGIHTTFVQPDDPPIEVNTTPFERAA